MVTALYAIGIVLFAQGIGGLINRLLNSDGPSWFLQLHLIPDDMRVLQIIVSILLTAAGSLIVWWAIKEAKKHGKEL